MTKKTKKKEESPPVPQSLKGPKSYVIGLRELPKDSPSGEKRNRPVRLYLTLSEFRAISKKALDEEEPVSVTKYLQDAIAKVARE